MGEPHERYRTVPVPVPGGALQVGIWEAARAAGAPTVLAVHGITSSHLVFSMLARQLPTHRIIAPDLRGRGRSAQVPGPFGLAVHADDVLAVADALSLRKVILTGHSMGGFVAVVALGRAVRRLPDLVSALVLLDGGIPLPTPAGAGSEYLLATLGPTAQRLRRTFADAAEYREFWRGHPALPQPWAPEVAEYFDHDLRPAGDGRLRPATDEAAMLADGREVTAAGGTPELLTGLATLGGLTGARPGGPGPVLLRAPRDLLDRPPGMYPPDWAADWARRVPALTIREVPGVNHYSLLLAEPGVEAVAAAVRAAGPPG